MKKICGRLPSIVSLQSLDIAEEVQGEPEAQRGDTPCWKACGRVISPYLLWSSSLLPWGRQACPQTAVNCYFCEGHWGKTKWIIKEKKKIEPPVFELSDSGAAQCLELSATCFRTLGSIIASSLTMPSENWGTPPPRHWEALWIPRQRSRTRGTWSPSFGNCLSFLYLFFFSLLEKYLALRNSGHT